MDKMSYDVDAKIILVKEYFEKSKKNRAYNQKFQSLLHELRYFMEPVDHLSLRIEIFGWEKVK